MIFAFVPLLLDSAGLELSTNWRVTNGAISVFGFGILIGIGTTLQRPFRLQTRRWEWWGLVGVSLAAIAIYVLLAIHAFGGFAGSGAFLNLLALVWLLAMASMNFILLLLATPRDSAV